jgi:arylsulfatase A-like enzyme
MKENNGSSDSLIERRGTGIIRIPWFMMKRLSTKTKVRKYLLICIIMIIPGLIFYLDLENHGKELKIIRVPFEKQHGGAPRKISFGDYAFQVEGTKYSLIERPGKYTRKFTLRGAGLLNLKSGAAENSKYISPPGKGQFIMDLFYFLLPAYPNQSTLILEIEAKGGVQKFRLEESSRLTRLQLPVITSPGNKVRFTLTGKGIAVISNPLFYPDDRKKEKQLVFLISADTLRRDHVGTYNPLKKCTPNIDQFARDSVVFNSAYSSSSWTLPAHVSLFSGQYPQSHNVNFAESSKNAAVFHSSVTHLQDKFITLSDNGSLFLSHQFGFSEGFDCVIEAKHSTSNPEDSRLLFHEVMDIIQKDQFGAPLFFFLHTYQIHSLFYPEEKIAEAFYGNDKPRNPFFDIVDFTKNGKDQYRSIAADEEIQDMKRIYEAGIHTFDYRFGEFIRFLKQRQLYNQSLIVFISDHGEEFGEHGGWAHGHSLYNELIQIPLICKFPDQKHSGLYVDHVVSIVDIMPTLLELTGIGGGNGRNIEGQSLIPTLSAVPGQRVVSAYLAKNAWNKTPMRTAAITREYKLVVNGSIEPDQRAFFVTPPPRVFKYEFFDLVKDPLERFRSREKNRNFMKLLKILKSRPIRKVDRSSKNLMESELKSLGYISD